MFENLYRIVKEIGKKYFQLAKTSKKSFGKNLKINGIL